MDRGMERLRRLLIVLVWVAYTVTIFIQIVDIIDHPRGGEIVSLIIFALIIFVITALAFLLHKAVNWIMMKDEEPEKE